MTAEQFGASLAALGMVAAAPQQRVRADAVEQALFDIYRMLGFDTNGARTPGELFGTADPGTFVIAFVREHLKDVANGEWETYEEAARVAEKSRGGKRAAQAIRDRSRELQEWDRAHR